MRLSSMQSEDVLMSSQRYEHGRRVSVCSSNSTYEYEEIKDGNGDIDREEKFMNGGSSSYATHAAADTQHRVQRQQRSSAVRNLNCESKDTDDSEDSQVEEVEKE